MSTEELDNTMQDIQENTNTAENEVDSASVSEEDIDFDDVPDDSEEQPEENSAQADDKAPSGKEDPAEEGKEDDDSTESGDNPFGFLKDVASAPDQQKAGDHSNEKDPQDPAVQEEKNQKEAKNPSGGTLADFDLDSLLKDLPEGEFKEFAEDYPAEARMAAFMTLRVLQNLGYESLQQNVMQFSSHQTALQQEAEQKSFEDSVRKIHTDVDDYISGEKRFVFAAWLKKQSSYVQRSFLSPDPEEAADVITRYKNSVEIQRKRHNERNAKFRNISGSTSTRQQSSRDDDWDAVPDDSVPEY